MDQSKYGTGTQIMMRILLIAWNDVRLFLKDKTGYLWLFLAPIGFMYFTGIPSQGPQSAPSNPRPSVIIDNQDEGFLGGLVIEELSTQGLRVIEPGGENQADRRIVIPAEFTDQVQSRKQVKLEYIKVEGSREESATMIEMRLLQAMLGINAHLVEWVSTVTETNQLDETALRALLADDDPVALEARFAGRNPTPSGFQQSLPGNLIMFMTMNLLIFGGTSVASERQNGVLRRLAALPVTRWQIITGKIGGRFLLGCVLIVFFVVLGELLFDVRIARDPLPLLLTLGIFAWLAASLGVFIGSVTANPDKTTGLCVLLSMMMGALGGCWWPLEVTSDTMQTIGHIFPTAWAMDALHQLISFGGGLAEVKTELGVLAGFAIASNLLAARFLRYTTA